MGLDPAGGSIDQGGMPAPNFSSPPEPSGFANFANFDEVGTSTKAHEEEQPKQPPSPPKAPRLSLVTSRQSSMKSIDSISAAGNPEVASLRRRVIELEREVQQLQSAFRGQHQTLRQLQAGSQIPNAVLEQQLCLTSELSLHPHSHAMDCRNEGTCFAVLSCVLMCCTRFTVKSLCLQGLLKGDLQSRKDSFWDADAAYCFKSLHTHTHDNMDSCPETLFK